MDDQPEGSTEYKENKENQIDRFLKKVSNYFHKNDKTETAGTPEASAAKESSEVTTEDLLNSLYETFLPQEYQSRAKKYTRIVLKMSWDDAVDVAAEFVKDYGKNKGGDGYKNTKQIIEDGLDNAIESKLLQALFDL